MMFIRQGKAATRGIKTLQRCELQAQSTFLRLAVTQNVCISRIYPKAQRKGMRYAFRKSKLEVVLQHQLSLVIIKDH